MNLDLRTIANWDHFADTWSTARALSNGRTREDWLAARATGIGGSEASAVMGVGRKSRYTLWAEKTGLAQPDDFDSEAAHWGTLLEGVILDEFAKRSGRKVRYWPQTLSVTHCELPWMRDTPDGLQWCERRGAGVVQVKTCSQRMGSDYGPGIGWGDDEEDADPNEWREYVPLNHQIQLQHEMDVCGADWGSLVVLIGGQVMRWWDVQRDDKFIATLIEAERAFMGLIERRESPEIDGSESTTQTVKKMHPRDNGDEVALPVEMLDAALELELVKADRKAMEDREAGLANQLRAAIGDATFGRLVDGTRYSLKTQTTEDRMVRGSTYRVLRKLKGSK